MMYFRQSEPPFAKLVRGAPGMTGGAFDANENQGWIAGMALVLSLSVVSVGFAQQQETFTIPERDEGEGPFERLVLRGPT